MWRSRLSGWLCDAHDIKNRRNAGGCLQRQLATLDLSPLLELAASDDPVVLAEARLRRAASQGRERWLREQLSRELLRSWQIEGFGDSLLRMLESHGLSNGEQLRANIDCLCSLPGFGSGREDLGQLPAIGCATKTFAGAIQALKPGSAIVAALCRPS